jgi:ubiquitin-protein ligase
MRQNPNNSYGSSNKKDGKKTSLVLLRLQRELQDLNTLAPCIHVELTNNEFYWKVKFYAAVPSAPSVQQEIPNRVMLALDIHFGVEYPFSKPRVLLKSVTDDREGEPPVQLPGVLHILEALNWQPDLSMSDYLKELYTLISYPITIRSQVSACLARHQIPVELRAIIETYCRGPTKQFSKSNIAYAEWLWEEHEDLAMLRYGVISLWDTSLVTVPKPNNHYPSDDPMTIFIKSLTGRKFTISAKPSETIHMIKEKITEIVGLFPSCYILLYEGKGLYEKKTLSFHNIQQNNILHMVTGNVTEVEREPGISQILSYQYVV